MWAVRIFSGLLMSASIIVPPFANEFLRRMKRHHILSFVVLCAEFSCFASTPSTVDVENRPAEIEVPPSYPAPSDESELDEAWHEDPWLCGSELIKTVGPGGELIVVEVPLPCDPHADVYMGCPPNFSVGKNEQ
jgi:hypothetical protein